MAVAARKFENTNSVSLRSMKIYLWMLVTTKEAGCVKVCL